MADEVTQREAVRRRLAAQPLAGALIGGAPRAGGAHELPLISPIDGRPVTALAEADPEAVAAAVAAAAQAFDAGVWSGRGPLDRAAVLRRAGAMIRAEATELAGVDCLLSGLPLGRSLLPQAESAAGWFEYYAAFLETRGESLFRQLGTGHALVTHEPVGVVALFTPWNIPLMSASLKLSAALAFGNSCVLKPSEMTPAGAVRLVEILHEAGVPPGVVNLVNGRGAVTGAALVGAPEVAAISFTGGGATGRRIAEQAAGRLAKVTMELGGKSASIVSADAELEQALAGTLRAVFGNNGQACIAGSRILVHRDIVDVFLDRFAAGAAAMTVGDPFAAATDMGPLITASHRERVAGFIERALAAGAELVRDGRQDTGASDCYLGPTALLVDDPDLEVWNEEIFGPVATLMVFDDDDQALTLANRSEFGLAAYVWSRDLTRALTLSERIRAGSVMVNTAFQRERSAPFGGYKQSGVNREGGAYSMDFFTEAKTTVIGRGDVSR